MVECKRSISNYPRSSICMNDDAPALCDDPAFFLFSPHFMIQMNTCVTEKYVYPFCSILSSSSDYPSTSM